MLSSMAYLTYGSVCNILEFWLRVRCLVARFFDVVQIKDYRIDDTVIKAIRPPFWQDILVLIKSVLW